MHTALESVRVAPGAVVDIFLDVLFDAAKGLQTEALYPVIALGQGLLVLVLLVHLLQLQHQQKQSAGDKGHEYDYHDSECAFHDGSFLKLSSTIFCAACMPAR